MEKSVRITQPVSAYRICSTRFSDVVQYGHIKQLSDEEIINVVRDFNSDVRSRMEPIIQQIEQEKLEYEWDCAELTKKNVDLEHELKDVKEEKDQLESENFYLEHELKDVKEDQKQLESDKVDLKDELENIKEKNGQLENGICKLKRELAGANAARLYEKNVHENEKLKYESDCAELTKKNVDLEHELKDVKEENEQLESEKVDLEDELENVKEENRQLENGICKLKRELAGANAARLYEKNVHENEKLKYESDCAELTKKNVDLEHELKDVKEENEQLESEKVDLEDELENVKEENRQLENGICKLKRELAGANAARLYEKNVHENEKLKYESDCAELTKKNVDLEHELKDVKEENEQLESEKVDLEDELENVKEENRQLENEKLKYESDCAELTKKNFDLEHELKDVKEENEQLESEKVDLEDELENVKDENRQLENEINKLNNELTDVKSEKREHENEMQTLRRNFNVQIEFLESNLKALNQPAVADQDKNIKKVQEVTTHKNVVADSRNGKVRKAQLDENQKKAPQVKQAYLKEKQIPMQVEIDKVAQREPLATKRKCNDSAVPSRNREFSAYQVQPDTMVKKIKRVETFA